MTRGPVIVAIDGSEASLQAARAGVELVAPGPFVIMVVIEPSDLQLVTGSGFAGGVMTPEELQAADEAREAAGVEQVEAAKRALGIDAETLVVQGDAGPMLCAVAGERDAAAIIMGTRGRGGLRRAFLGSVSDHVVRNAPCPVIVSGEPG